ncbi:MAG TPA: hypothetical protein P5061_15070, partial [Mycobacterium sp.]|nr:hypothetical protein [Mycobacterium sp.]
MSAGASVVAARRPFDRGMDLMDHDPAEALRQFTEATRLDPAMADAWLARITAGDDDLATLE